MDTRSESLPPRAEALLSQSDWVRALVRGLGVDESAADDVLQSTWMAAIATPPRTEGEGASMRAWLARVARNFALKRLGRDKNRAARERASAKDERLPSAADVVEREEARGQVVQALLGVPEPYRTTLLLRFYENLEPRDIARLQRVPGSTVRNRLRRGLELLRERLERDLGETWRQRCILVLPLVPAFPAPTGGANAPGGGSGHGSGGAPSWNPANGTTGGGLVVEKIGLAAAALLATGGLVLTWTWTSSSGVESSSPTASLSSEIAANAGSNSGEPSGANSGTELVSAELGRSRERASNPVDSHVSGGGDVRCVLHGRLLGPDGQPLKPASQFLGTKISFVSAADFSAESAGPSYSASVSFEGNPEVGVERKRVALGSSALGEAPGPLVPQRTDDLDAAEKPAEPAQQLFLSEVPIVGRFFLDSTVGFESPDLHARVVLSNDAGEALESSIDGDGVFRFENLRADHWHLFAEAPGCQSKRMEVEIDSQGEKILNVSLDAVLRLRVKLVTPDGKDLRGAILADPNLALSFVPVPFARRACPNESTRDLSRDPALRYGSGRWKNGSDFPDETLGDASGILEISDPLPLFVGVSACGIVLDSRIVTSGEEDVVFVIAPERIRVLPASVGLRVVSGQDGLPLEGVVVSIEGFPEVVTDASGTIESRNVPHGRRLLVLEAPGHGRREELIDILPGARNDLGTRSLGPPVEISGRVVGKTGDPLRVSVELTSIDRFVLGLRMPFAGKVDTAEDGTFRFSDVGDGRYLLFVENIADTIMVDTRAGKATDLVVRESERHTVRVMFPIEPPPDASYLVEMADGTPIQVTPCEGWKPLEVVLGEGSYRSRLVDGPGAIWTKWIRVQSGEVIVTDEPLEEER